MHSLTNLIRQYFEDIDYNKIVTLEVRVRVIKGVDLYDLVQATKMCLVLNMVVPKHFYVPKFIKYTGTQYPVTHLKSYCNKMVEVMHDKKIIDTLLSERFEWGNSKLVYKIRQQKDSKIERPRGCFH